MIRSWRFTARLWIGPARQATSASREVPGATTARGTRGSAARPQSAPRSGSGRRWCGPSPARRAATAPPPPARAGAVQAIAAQQQTVDVAAVLTDLASKNPQKLDWRHSIVDLMKLLGLDSGRGAQATRPGAWRGRRRGQLRGDERVAAQAGHADAGGERRQGAGRPAVVGRSIDEALAPQGSFTDPSEQRGSGAGRRPPRPPTLFRSIVRAASRRGRAATAGYSGPRGRPHAG